MRVVGMNYQDDAWPEMSGALSGALAGGVISIGAENFVPPEYFMAQAWSLSDIFFEAASVTPSIFLAKNARRE